MKVALISGGSSGIGKAIAKEFVNSGIKVAILARKRERLDAAVEELKQIGGRAIGVCADVTDVFSLKKALERVKSEFGRLDILVNSAGGGPVGGIMDITDSQWNENIAVKQMGYVKLTREAIPYIKESGGGNIINIIGVFGKQPHSNFIIGSMTNSALLSFTKAISEEMAQYNIRVNAINPGACDTPLWSNTLKEMSEKIGGDINKINDEIANLSPFKRISKPEDVAKLAAFMISDNASFITGVSVNVDGGAYRGIA